MREIIHRTWQGVYAGTKGNCYLMLLLQDMTPLHAILLPQCFIISSGTPFLVGSHALCSTSRGVPLHPLIVAGLTRNAIPLTLTSCHNSRQLRIADLLLISTMLEAQRPPLICRKISQRYGVISKRVPRTVDLSASCRNGERRFKETDSAREDRSIELHSLVLTHRQGCMLSTSSR